MAIALLSALGMECDSARRLEPCAGDYVATLFGPAGLLARAETVLLRRVHPLVVDCTPQIDSPLVIDYARCCAVTSGQEVHSLRLSIGFWTVSWTTQTVPQRSGVC